MWIVRLALRRPYTFVVVAALIALLGLFSIVRMPIDIFPTIDIPVVSVIWSYGTLSATDVQDRIMTVVERAMTTTVSNIEHIESVSLRGTGVIKLYFQPEADVNAAVAQVTAICQTLLRPLPPGITPPLILQYNAASVPVLMLSLGSQTLSEQEINDLGNKLHPYAVGRDRGRVGAIAVRRKIARGERRHRSRCALLTLVVARRRQLRVAVTEPRGHARNGEDGSDRIRRSDQQQPGDSSTT